MKTTGGKRKRYKKGGATQIAVPTMQVLYPETGAGNQTVNGNITATTTLGATSSANSIYDVCVGQGPNCTSQVTSSQTAGKRYKHIISKRKISKRKRSKKGGIKWGCYSGGSKKHRKSKKKYRKYK